MFVSLDVYYRLRLHILLFPRMREVAELLSQLRTGETPQPRSRHELILYRVIKTMSKTIAAVDVAIEKLL